MKRHLIFLFMVVSLVSLAACSFVDSEQGWTTISQSKDGEPFYRLEVSGKKFRILYNVNGSVRKIWKLYDYNSIENFEIRTLNEAEIQGLDGATAEKMLSGQGSADFTMVYESIYNSQVERTYFKVHIEVNDKGDVDTKESSMTFVKNEKEDINQESKGRTTTKKGTDSELVLFNSPQLHWQII